MCMNSRKEVSVNAFLALVRAGLWEQDVQILPYEEIDFSEIQQLAEEQSVIGLVTAGLEHVVDMTIPKQDLLQLVGRTLQIEEQNRSMNKFVGELVGRMRKAEIYTLLVKGQGVAQCYERPLWRASGDVDLYLSDSNYQSAKAFLTPFASYVEEEDKRKKHYGVSINQWTVELHGTMHTYISTRINRVLDEVHRDIFYNGSVRSWMDDGIQVFLPSSDNDVIIVFTHFINHFYGEGIGLRQICDWCRLLWTYRDSIDTKLLHKRIERAGLMTEWRTFGALAVDILGMPADAMSFYSGSKLLKKRTRKLCNHIIISGSNRIGQDNSYRINSPRLLSHIITFWRRLKEFIQLSTLFPINAPKFFINYLLARIKAVL